MVRTQDKIGRHQQTSSNYGRSVKTRSQQHNSTASQQNTKIYYLLKPTEYPHSNSYLSNSSTSHFHRKHLDFKKVQRLRSYKIHLVIFTNLHYKKNPLLKIFGTIRSPPVNYYFLFPMAHGTCRVFTYSETFRRHYLSCWNFSNLN